MVARELNLVDRFKDEPRRLFKPPRAPAQSTTSFLPPAQLLKRTRNQRPRQSRRIRTTFPKKLLPTFTCTSVLPSPQPPLA
ncbi:hypothetical protein Ciccas_014564 [Cichlidogyrus casuarinus]|uniref:Uncharacterized protein n=1 Tax=Cichlidogyrus casuarinus TaxID=1844966 RepID=A0ABD2PJI0_9PLAT